MHRSLYEEGQQYSYRLHNVNLSILVIVSWGQLSVWVMQFFAMLQLLVLFVVCFIKLWIISTFEQGLLV